MVKYNDTIRHHNPNILYGLTIKSFPPLIRSQTEPNSRITVLEYADLRDTKQLRPASKLWLWVSFGEQANMDE